MTKHDGSNKLFPVFLKMEEMKVLLAGAGPVGVEKATAILNNSPECRLKVVAEHILDEMYLLKEKFPLINIEQRKFEENDLNGIQILLLAINNIELSKEIKQLANAKNILVNVADTPDLCDFYLSSVVQKGNLKIAISTNGKSPTVAKRLRELFEESIPDSMELLLQNINELRETLKGDFSEKVRQLNELTESLKINRKK